MLGSHDLKFFGVIATSPSLAAAARALDVTPPAVSQRLQLLERRLGVRLADRSNNRLHLTAEGEILAARGLDVLDDLDSIAAMLAARQKTVAGPLRVAAPLGFGRAYVSAAMATMRKLYPAVDLTLMLYDDPAGSVRGDSWDVLIHVGPLANSGLVMQRLAPNERLLCAAPSYLERHGNPATTDELRRHDCGVIREDQADVSLWRFHRPPGATTAVRIRPAFASNDGDVITSWALEGLGIVQRSEWAVADLIKAGRLIRLLPDWKLPDANVVALLGHRAGRAMRTDQFLSILRERFSPPPWRTDAQHA